MTTDRESALALAAEIYRQYRDGGPPPLGDCQLLAAILCLAIPDAEPVGGVCSDEEDIGPHWWCELPDGTILDPLGADWQAGGIQARELQLWGVPALLQALRRTWPEAEDLADRLAARGISLGVCHSG